MKAKTTKYLCDICGKEVPRIDYYKGRIATRYIVKLDCDFLKKQKADLCGQCYKKMTDWIRKEMETFTIYEEGFQVMEGTGRAHYIGIGQGETFLDACKDFIAKTGYGEIKTDANGNEYACEWGCRWFPTLEEAQRSFG